MKVKVTGWETFLFLGAFLLGYFAGGVLGYNVGIDKNKINLQQQYQKGLNKRFIYTIDTVYHPVKE